ncbi:unnamed protein product [Pleuronectes platessa]|uniref:P2X purinoreceptor 7 intracellular domain-containing protein n=1 Tax=Pleuronectes platessa TaxID=8262 RepID=A0A9N7Y678_PLEPL|nr:unnamed protein product [Pleuronectes platessa]
MEVYVRDVMRLKSGGIIGMQIKWDCDLDWQKRHCLPKYSFRRLDERENNKTLHHGLNFKFAKYNTVNGVEERTLYKAFGIRFDVMVFGQAGRFSFIQLIVYIGSTLSYFTVWSKYSKRRVETVQDQQKQEDTGHLRAVLCLLQPDVHINHDAPPPPVQEADPKPKAPRPAWCRCNCCAPSSLPQEELCCRRSACITSSPLFKQLVLHRPLLEAVLLYRDPLSPPGDPLSPPHLGPASLRVRTLHQLEIWAPTSRRPPCDPLLLRAKGPGVEPEPGRTVQRLHSCQDGVHAGLC